MANLVTNYARDVIVDLTFTDDTGATNPYPIPGGTTVEAVLKDIQQQAMTPKKTVLESAPKSNWANGRAVVQFTAADMADEANGGSVRPGQGIVELSVGGMPAATQRIPINQGIVPTL